MAKEKKEEEVEVEVEVEVEGKKKEEDEGTFVVQDIPTQTAPMVVNKDEGVAYPIEAVLAKVLNNQEEIKEEMKHVRKNIEG